MEGFAQAGLAHFFGDFRLTYWIIDALVPFSFVAFTLSPKRRFAFKLNRHLTVVGLCILCWCFPFGLTCRYTFFSHSIGACSPKKTTYRLSGLTFYGNFTFRFASPYPPTGFSTELFGRLWDLISSSHFSIEHQLFTAALVLELNPRFPSCTNCCCPVKYLSLSTVPRSVFVE